MAQKADDLSKRTPFAYGSGVSAGGHRLNASKPNPSGSVYRTEIRIYAALQRALNSKTILTKKKDGGATVSGSKPIAKQQ